MDKRSLLRELQNSDFRPNPRFSSKIRILRKSPILNRVFQFAQRPNLDENHRILPRKRALQFPLLKSRFAYAFSCATASLFSICSSSVQAAPAASGPPSVSIEYQAKDFSHLYGMPGFSDQLLKMHFQLYQGYVKNTNLLLNRLKDLELQDRDQTYDYGALKRRVGWEFDGMRLHELYFENLGARDPFDKSTPLNQRMYKDFGSFEAWKKNFISTGMIRGIGWVILYRDPQSGRLINTWINEHDLGHLAGGDPLLVMDVFEHAYITQYGLDRGKYINAFFENINWAKVLKRYTDSVKNSSSS